MILRTASGSISFFADYQQCLLLPEPCCVKRSAEVKTMPSALTIHSALVILQLLVLCVFDLLETAKINMLHDNYGSLVHY